MSVAPFYLDRPLNIAHRGARDSAPENTLAAFELALAHGADGIELDVTRCCSGEIVVLHDDTIDRTTNGSGRIEDLDYDTLLRLDAGGWFASQYEGERIPRLADVLDTIGGKLRINIEIKGRSRRSNGIEREIAEMVRTRSLSNSVIISSFNPWALGRMKAIAPELPLALLYSLHSPLWLRRGQAHFWIRPQALHPERSLVNERYVQWAKRRGYRVNVWTVNDEAEMRNLVALGVDGIITDRPALLSRVLGENH
ncbi:MAG: glycerophosphodiester phosphodiesterase [Chloroflexi bacterium]|jgi:glycerophosphoryl diester phosphodiesterase|nr:glycerophosphodiester phosphodiesterase [Chloroflexota bacterium]